MSNARKKAKQEKKARLRKEKAKTARARHVEQRAESDGDTRKSTPDRKNPMGLGGRPSSKPAGSSGGPGHRTQGK